jgi:hypothetical protein
MELRCPNCGNLDLKKISLAYEAGRHRVDTRTRLRGFLFGSDGPNVIVGRAVMHGVHETQLSKRLRPPMKWSYLKLGGWSVFVAFPALIAYVHSVMSTSKTASSAPLTIFAVVFSCMFASLVGVVWRHNHAVYPREYAQWNRSFLCQRCGGVSEQALG